MSELGKAHFGEAIIAHARKTALCCAPHDRGRGWHRLKLDPKIAAGPITLGLADLFASRFYFTSA